MNNNAPIFNTYYEKQNHFVNLVKDIQISLNSKDYKNYNCSFNDYIRMKWNISQAQAYRYLISAKVIDQLTEFKIQPCYERLCRSLYNVAKTPSQMKLLWSTILAKAGGRPDCINSTHVNRIWKELCDKKEYSHICHFEDNLMNRIEETLNKYTNDKKHKQMNSKSKYTNEKKHKQINTKTKNISSHPSPITPITPGSFERINNEFPELSKADIKQVIKNNILKNNVIPTTISSNNLAIPTNYNTTPSTSSSDTLTLTPPSFVIPSITSTASTSTTSSSCTLTPPSFVIPSIVSTTSTSTTSSSCTLAPTLAIPSTTTSCTLAPTLTIPSMDQYYYLPPPPSEVLSYPINYQNQPEPQPQPQQYPTNYQDQQPVYIYYNF